MEKVFVDTNIILDWLANRQPFHISAQKLFKKVEDKEIELLISAVSYTTTEYFLRKQIGKAKARQALAAIRTISSVCKNYEKEIDLSIASNFKDFEDAFQYYSALNNAAKVLITRNLKDFKHSVIPIMNAEAYLKTI